MTKKELRQIAKNLLMESIGTAYYKLENESYTPEEEEAINKYIWQYGEAMGKAIKEKFTSY